MYKENFLKVRREIDAAARTSGRKPEDIVLVAVTKTAPIDAISQVIEAGALHIAENRVQEAEAKFPVLTKKYPQVTTHIIGHLQSNKAKDALQVVALIQSIDSIKLANEVQKQALKLGKPADVLLQFNTAREDQKYGAAPEEAEALFEAVSKLDHVRVKGLMTMAPYTDDAGIIRKTFADLRGIKEQMEARYKGQERISLQVMSMGMSGDYKIAIEEGSTMVRVGSAIFK